MKAKQAFISISLAIWLLGSSVASAALIDFEAVNGGPGGPRAAFFTYGVASHVFTATTPFGTPSAPATLEFVPGFFLIQDLVGTFLLIADIDNAGVLHSGIYTWNGRIPTLGILAPTTLMSGRLLSLAITNDGNSLFFAGTADTVNPLLQARVGPIGSAGLQFISFPPFEGFPWTGNMGGFGATESPDIFGFAPAAIPDPSTVGLELLGLAGLGWHLIRRRRAVGEAS